MAKQGEKDYLKNLGKEGAEHTLRKPFSDANCGNLLMQMGAVMRLLPPPPGRLLDLGCGAGWTSRFLAKHGYEVTGIDIAEDMIRLAETARGEEGIENARFLAGDYESEAFRGEFRGALFFDSLHHCENETDALRAAWRALEPGGVCILSEPGKGHAHAKTSVEAVKKYNVNERDMPPGKIIRAAKHVGFSKWFVYPHAAYLDWSMYERSDAPLHRTAMARTVIGLVKVCYTMLVHKWRNGIVLLIK